MSLYPWKRHLTDTEKNLEHWFPTFHLSTELFFGGRSAQNAVKLWLRSEKLVSIKQNIVSNILHNNGFFLVYADIAGIYVISKTILDWILQPIHNFLIYVFDSSLDKIGHYKVLMVLNYHKLVWTRKIFLYRIDFINIIALH